MTGHNADLYHGLLAEYASGCLDEAFALAVAAHLSLNLVARDVIRTYEAVGGAMLESCCPPVEMKPGALQAVMARLGSCSQTAAPSPCAGKPKLNLSNYQQVPGCLDHYMSQSVWRDSGAGYEILSLHTRCSSSAAHMIRLPAGQELLPCLPRRSVLALILHGGAGDVKATYNKGELFFIDAATMREMQADRQHGAIIFTVTKRPGATAHVRRLLSWLGIRA